uniref:Uncharacterized protein n=1 Tax=Entomoneis paludosa TaxID=265537 RepID=A0A7S2VD11_9STRA|mmetsp:Transcript_16697/g.34453  ORF Transcript_16697/g.34453 Transcript_16697/m.34453 type:complete len:360 (+) Transcript_16697:515-1594(+)|eukprot:CAMPEP_0172444442 /NCGR_PEP_ID=MMETSP1065-20121228/4484_1 /TAXON_ID=265537 /ORGANISM="Amphiprora paludosa, Strain CCMP125" /LENGTH=359 /DNA_ID=CAMNT_0013194981 /DNA_START=160 /DNA_END=1239 /DNA_ORIENTATION=+
MSTALLPTDNFPHPILTKVVGQPTPKAMQLFRKELYANAMSVASTRGGGQNGHLALMMDEPTYTALAGVAFVVPVHPGDQPAHAHNATAAQMTETNRQYDKAIVDFNAYVGVRNKLRSQILEAVDNTYYATLEHDQFGYAQVTPFQLLDELATTYDIIRPEDITANAKRLEEALNPDDPLETLWLKIATCRLFATRAQEPISEATAMRLTLIVFDNTGVFEMACDLWRRKADADKTYHNFKSHFNAENAERLRRITAQNAGFHGANTADEATPSTPATREAANAVTPSPAVQPNGDVPRMYYCYTHGLGFNPNHYSATCENKCEGHKDDATASNMMGGNNRIMPNRSGARRAINTTNRD